MLVKHLTINIDSFQKMSITNMSFSIKLFLLPRIHNVTYTGVLFTNFSTLDRERCLFDKQSDSLTCDIGYQQA